MLTVLGWSNLIKRHAVMRSRSHIIIYDVCGTLSGFKTTGSLKIGQGEAKARKYRQQKIVLVFNPHLLRKRDGLDNDHRRLSI